MSTFEVKVIKIDESYKHPDADALTVNRIGGYLAVSNLMPSGEWRYKTGDYAVYIPEGAVLPKWLLRKVDAWDEVNNKGKLGGPQGNRVYPIKLRGILSQGMLLQIYPRPVPVMSSYGLDLTGRPDLKNASPWAMVHPGDDVAHHLGIVKYVPEIPDEMKGQVCDLSGFTLKFDIENEKKYRGLIPEGTLVTYTEKVHGTFCEIGVFFDTKSPYITHEYFVTSKGLVDQGLAFKDVTEIQYPWWQKIVKFFLPGLGWPKYEAVTERNVYQDAIRNIFSWSEIWDRVDKAMTFVTGLQSPATLPFYILGEVHGPGIQSGFNYGKDKPELAVFDIYVGAKGSGRWLNRVELVQFCKYLNIPAVPVLYEGPHSIALMEQHASGKTVVGKDVPKGTSPHIREGIIIRPLIEQTNPQIGRVILKSISPKYLTRSDPNATEYQ